MKSVLLDGRDITDTPIEIRSGQEITRVSMTFTDAVSEINGTLTTDQGVPVTDYTVLAFPTDSSLWRAQSRHIATARPDQNGKFRIRNLPAGSYYMATVDPSQQGEWFEPAYLEEHRLGATNVAIGDGETKTQDFKIRIQNWELQSGLGIDWEDSASQLPTSPDYQILNYPILFSQIPPQELQDADRGDWHRVGAQRAMAQRDARTPR